MPLYAIFLSVDLFVNIQNCFVNIQNCFVNIEKQYRRAKVGFTENCVFHSLIDFVDYVRLMFAIDNGSSLLSPLFYRAGTKYTQLLH